MNNSIINSFLTLFYRNCCFFVAKGVEIVVFYTKTTKTTYKDNLEL